MNLPQKYTVPIVAVLCLAIGFASAAVLAGINNDSKGVNIFERTKNECPGIKWLKAADTTHLSSPLSVTGELYFAGERVPLEDPEVRERLDRELQINVNWHSNTILGMKQANRYFDEIESVLVAQGVPADFKYLPLIESNFRYDASPAGAVGFWQFVKGTGTSFGLEVNDEVDERYNDEKATIAACAFLKDAKDKLGNWTIAAAAYNLGVPSMMRRIKDQDTNNYYEMFFNPETSRYVFRMLALKILFSNPKSAGFAINPDDLYQPYKYKIVEVDTPIASISAFAQQYGLRYKHIKMLNPWLRDAVLTNKTHKKYQIKILQTN